MYLKRLEIVGFKSFLNKTVLNFEPGITAVVGPNGCGKSNIFDSMRWALGEQSVKSLRGSDMQDVIFNGTDLKDALSMAEVSIAFDNNNRFFPIEQDEVLITRRLFRSGESEYLLNKTEVRLKDILELLMGTGIGAESYSLVEQGKIGLILSARPEDRRLVFDEASGITKYKTQKREALRKLEETEQNLLRVNDIVTEVKRQIGSLERQANKARRYKEVFEELKSKELNIALLQNNSLKEQNAQILNRIDECTKEENGLFEQIKAGEALINSHTDEIKNTEDQMLAIKNIIMNLDNFISRNTERIKFNKERIIELGTSQDYLLAQIEQTKNRLNLDEEKLNNIKKEYDTITSGIVKSKVFLKENEDLLLILTSEIKVSLNSISEAKRGILDLINKISGVKNEITGLVNKQHIHLARKKRLDIEKAKVHEEKSSININLDALTSELNTLANNFANLSTSILTLKKEQEGEIAFLNNFNTQLAELEKDKLTLVSRREFLENLKTQYEHIGDASNAVIYLDKIPQDDISGLVVKIKERLELTGQDKELTGNYGFKLRGEAKSLDLDTKKLDTKIAEIEMKINTLKNSKLEKEGHLRLLDNNILGLQESARKQEIELANKKTFQQGVAEQLNKISEEEGVIMMEFSDVERELQAIEKEILQAQSRLSLLEGENAFKEKEISVEQEKINQNNAKREKATVEIAQTKTQIEAQTRRLASDEATVKILQDTYAQDKEAVLNLETQISDAQAKQNALDTEAEELQIQIQDSLQQIEAKKQELSDTELKYKNFSRESIEANKKLEAKRKELDSLKNRMYELQMQAKDIDFKILGLKERLSQAYKIDLDSPEVPAPSVTDENILSDEIKKLKEKLDSYGTVNLVAIEEYDELKKRYDFLTQQHDDLTRAKDSIHDAILKINRTTKKMFLDTFELIRQEFRNYFRLLFNGGDAQIFLLDEQDPLESGIEIICRPPGKKLQNVLLLSGGEKTMSAIALIFAIFKVKPSPFCVLDEIDAALDEANVDRFGSMLQDFTKTSQFIVITHNKKTIVNADVMYGITMEESGVSKIVSVKFGQKEKEEEKELVAEAEGQAEPV